MVTIINRPYECLEHWLKASPLADVTHCILRYDGLLLVAYCGCIIPLQDARKPVMGARHCVECESLHRQRERVRKLPGRNSQRSADEPIRK